MVDPVTAQDGRLVLVPRHLTGNRAKEKVARGCVRSRVRFQQPIDRAEDGVELEGEHEPGWKLATVEVGRERFRHLEAAVGDPAADVLDEVATNTLREARPVRVDLLERK